ncbi:MAG TPA: MarR family transcriptional regulator, partial [Streptomyces sp.]
MEPAWGGKSLDVKRLDIKRLHVDTTTTLIAMEDEVDRLVAAWRRERPDLDVEPLEVLSRVSRLARHLD